jgi:hypothetical protein
MLNSNLVKNLGFIWFLHCFLQNTYSHYAEGNSVLRNIVGKHCSTLNNRHTPRGQAKDQLSDRIKGQM